jgi:hypothetical protein
VDNETKSLDALVLVESTTTVLPAGSTVVVNDTELMAEEDTADVDDPFSIAVELTL